MSHIFKPYLKGWLKGDYKHRCIPILQTATYRRQNATLRKYIVEVLDFGVCDFIAKKENYLCSDGDIRRT